jgi:hypothetical protein
MSNNKETFIIKLKDEGVVSGLKRAGNETDRAHKKTSALNGAFRVFGGILAGISIAHIGGEIVETLSKFERFESVLTNTLGSGSAAQKALADITKFAAKTPFEVDGLTDSFVKLANQGFVPTMLEMTKLGDIAASKGKELNQLAEAVIDAEVGEFERLKEFGIRAKKEGDRVSFTFKGVTANVKNTDKAIRAYILSIGDAAGVSGAMAAISATTGGKISNLKDTLTTLYLTIGQKLKPEIDGLIEGFKSALEYTKDFVEWLSAGSTGAEALKITVASLVVGLTAYNVVQKAVLIATNAAAAATFLWNAALALNPVTLVIGTIAALGVAIYIAYQKFDKFRAVINGTWEVLKQMGTNIKNNFLEIPALIIKAFQAIPRALKQIFGGVVQLFSAIKNGEIGKIGDIIKNTLVNNDVVSVGREILGKAKENGQTTAAAYKKGYSDTMNAASEQRARDAMTNDEWFVNTGKNSSSTPDPLLGGGSAKGKGLGSGLSAVVASAPKVFNINIESLIKEQSFTTTNLKETSKKIKEEVTRVLLAAVNDSQIISE